MTTRANECLWARCPTCKEKVGRTGRGTWVQHTRYVQPAGWGPSRKVRCPQSFQPMPDAVLLASLEEQFRDGQRDIDENEVQRQRLRAQLAALEARDDAAEAAMERLAAAIARFKRERGL